jgi:2-polyprenyl-3-methyl-5-hydroxy-6-metoxy-1,4-benzoquinol methylase
VRPALEMQLEAIVCPLCNSTGSTPWALENGYTAVKCEGCGLVYVNPRPPLQRISEASKTGVHQTNEGSLTVTFSRSEKKIRHYGKVIKTMFATEIARAEPIRWLDVGAGYGEFVEAVLSAMPPGSDVCGIEPMKPKVDSAKARGLPIVDTPLSQLEGKFDVISLINVFSHIPNFSAFLREVVDHCSPRGILFLETGNGGDVQRSQYPDDLYLPDHLVFAGTKHIERFLQKAGFRAVMTREQRIDSASSLAKGVVKNVLKGRPDLAIARFSPFRTVFFKAQRSEQ